MIKEGLGEFGFMVLYAVAAITGGMGGCATALNVLKHHQHKRGVAPFVCAYIVLGVVFGILTLAGLYVIDKPPTTIHHLVLQTALGGSVGSVALALVNYTARVVFDLFGIKVQVTIRRDGDERRNGDGEPL